MPFIDRDPQGNITAIYHSRQRDEEGDLRMDQEYVEGDVQLWKPAPSPIEQIRALEAASADDQAKLTRQSLLAIALDKACALPNAAGLTRAQVHAALMLKDNGYAGLFNLEQQIAALRAQL